jgi:uncharacterized spore protein YtfJ
MFVHGKGVIKMNENSYEDSFKVTCDKLVALAKGQGVLASPIEVGSTIIVPVSELKVAFGGGGGQGVGEGDSGAGPSGQGKAMASVGVGNVKVNPVAFIVIDGDTITLETVDEEGETK